LFSASAFAQSPQGFTYQAVVRDASGDLVISSSVGVRISILDFVGSESPLYMETHSASTNANGLFSISVGTAPPPVVGSFSTIDWGSSAHYIKTEIDPAGGTNYTITGTQQLMSVPYALYAASSGTSSASSWQETGNDISNNNSGNVGIGTSSPAEKLDVSGRTRTTDLQMTNGAADGHIMQSDASGNATWVDASTLSATGDDLGDHTATQNIQLGSNYLTNDGGTEGISINTNGQVTIRPASASIPLYLTHGNTPALRFSQDNTSGFTAYSWDWAANESAFFLRDVNNGNAIPFRVQPGQSNNRLVLRNNNVGIGLIEPTSTLDVNGTTKTINFQMTNGAANGYILQSDASGNASWVVNLGGTNYWTLSGSNLYNNSGTNVGIGTLTPTEKLDVIGTTRTTNFQMTNGATNGHLLQSDASGNASWVSASSFANDTMTLIADADNNTKVETEQSANEDFIRFTLNGTEYFRMNRGTLEFNNTTKSIYIGNASGGSDTYLGLGENTAVGANAMQSIDVNSNKNVAVGTRALQSLTGTGAANVAIGLDALRYNTGGSGNTALGKEAGLNATGSRNVFIGRLAGADETGNDKLYIDNSNTTTPLIHGDFSTNKVTINDSLQSKYFRMTNGATNGYFLQSDANGNGTWVASSLSVDAISYIGTSYVGITSGVGGTGTSEGTSANRNNVFIGEQTGFSNTDGHENVFLGYTAGRSNTSGDNNFFAGNAAGFATTSGGENLAIGYGAMTSNVDGYNNVALGRYALRYATYSDHNVAIGFSALSNFAYTNGNSFFEGRNVAIGGTALRNTNPTASTNGVKNVGIGYGAGSTNTTGDNNTFIGSGANSSSGTLTNATAIGANASVSTSNSLVLGSNVNVGIGTSSPESTLDVNGSFAAAFKTPLVAGTTNPDATAMVWRYTSGSGTITLPTASTCEGRIIVIINQTGTSRTISSYRDLTTTPQTSLGSSVALWVMSDGSEWWQIK